MTESGKILVCSDPTALGEKSPGPGGKGPPLARSSDIATDAR